MSNAKLWRQADQAWTALSRREKLLICMTACVIPVMLAFVFFLEPSLKQIDSAEKEIASLERSVETHKRMLQILQRAELPDPNAKAQKKLDALVNRLNSIDSQVDQFARKLVGPEQMMGLLHSMLGSDEKIRIVKVFSLPVQPLKLKKEDEEPQLELPLLTAEAKEKARQKAMAEAVIYVHPFEMQLKGDYEALYNYLRKAESLHRGFFWDQLEYSADTYPDATIRIRVHTLSTEESWLGA